MKLLITGGTASQVRESTNRQANTFAGLMAIALRERGYEVDVRPFAVQDIEHDVTGQDNDYDFSFVGQSPLKGLGSSYMYCALAAQHRFNGKFAIFSDDVSTRKMSAEWQAAIRRPEDFVKTFWQYKRDWIHARRSTVLPKLLDQIKILIGNDDSSYPHVFIPAWTYDLAFQSAIYLSPYARFTTHGCDPSSWLTTDLQRHVPIDDKPYWATSASADSRETIEMGARLWDVQTVNRLTWKELESASGVLVPSAGWSPELRLALILGLPVVTDWKTMGNQFGGSFEGLAANVELLSQVERNDLAAEQMAALVAKSSTREDFPDILEKMINKTLEKQ